MGSLSQNRALEHTHTHMHTYRHTYTHAYMHACMRTHIHAYMHMHDTYGAVPALRRNQGRSDFLVHDTCTRGGASAETRARRALTIFHVSWHLEGCLSCNGLTTTHTRHTHIHACMHTYAHTYIHIHTRMDAYKHTYIHT